jgi:hypothetical protein
MLLTWLMTKLKAFILNDAIETDIRSKNKTERLALTFLNVYICNIYTFYIGSQQICKHFRGIKPYLIVMLLDNYKHI